MTAKNNLRSILCVLSLSMLIACGGGEESPDSAVETQLPPQPTTHSYSVTVIDGYLSSAKVWLDLNDNGSQDTNEPTTITEKNGKATLTIDSNTDPKNYSVMVLAQAGITFDESLNQLITKDFILASPKGENIVTPLTTLIYLKSREVGDIESAKSLISEQLNLTPQRIFSDFIALNDTEQEIITADIVRLSLMAESEDKFKKLISGSNVLFENISEYLALRVRDDNQIKVIRDLAGALARDTDLDDIADTDDLDIDGDGIFNYEDDNPLLAEFNTIKNPGEIKVSESLTGNIVQYQWQYFTVESPENVMLNFSLSNLTDDVDLYVKQGESPTKFDYQCRSNLSNSEPEKCVVRAKKVSTYHIGVLARQNASFELLIEAEAIVYQKVMLLLHGLASDPGTWDAMVNDDSFFNGNCQTLTIDNDTLLDVETNNDGISCFNLEFGSLDRYSEFSATGLDNKTCNNVSGCNGDYTAFEGLGYEVDTAIESIVDKLGPDIEVFMFGHSRGGLAARSYLQNSELTNRSLIKGFATTGTPHQGSPLGRFYQYMHNNCIPKSTYRQDNSKCEDNWEVIELLNGTRELWGVSVGKYEMDLQAPSIDFLSPDSSSINSLNENLSNMKELITGVLIYEGTKFGHIGKDVKFYFDYDLYQYQSGVGDHPHPDTLRYIESGQTRESFIGDGIVPSYSQKFSLLLESEGLIVTKEGINKTSDVLHTEETSKVSDINWLFEGLYPSLGWK